MLTCWVELLYSHTEEHLKRMTKMAAVRASGSTLVCVAGAWNRINGHQKDWAREGGTRGKRKPSSLACFPRVARSFFSDLYFQAPATQASSTLSNKILKNA